MNRRVTFAACLLALVCAAPAGPGLTRAATAAPRALTGTLHVYDFLGLGSIPAGKKVIAEYERMHPGVTIKIDPLSPTYPTQYQESVLDAGTASDVFASVWVQQEFPDVPKGYWTDLTPYLNQPNPYVKGNKRWLDTFVPQIVQQVGFLGHYYQVSPNAQDALFFYNKDIFAKAGITHTPTSWAELMDDSARIKKANYIPDLYYLGDTYGLAENSSIISLLENQVMSKTLHRIDLNHDGIVDLRELVAGIKHRTFSPMNADYQEAWKLLKQWSQYWQPNAIANLGTVNVAQVKSMAQFLRGQVGMTYVGTVQANIALSTVKVPFKWGVFRFPQVTPASSTFATPGEKGVGIWGADNGYPWCVPTVTSKRGTTALAVDFIRWFTAPQNNVPISLQNGVIPITKGWAPRASDAVSTNAYYLINHPTMQGSAEVALGLQWIDQRVKVQQQYLTGAETLSQAMSDMQRYTDAAADGAISLYHLSIT